MRRFCTPERFFWSQVLATVLHSRRVALKARSIHQGAALMDLSSNTITTMDTSWDMFCNGMSIMQDGRVLINGGTKGYGALAVVGAQGDIPFTGLANTSIFDPASESFVDVAPTAHGRWYPTMTELNDGRMMTTSGLNDSDGLNNNTSEIWDGQQWGAEIPGNPHITDFPTFQFPLYPRMHLLPTGHVFYSAPSSATVDFNPSNQTWTLVAWTIYPGRRSERRANLWHLRTSAADAAEQLQPEGHDHGWRQSRRLILPNSLI